MLTLLAMAQISQTLSIIPQPTHAELLSGSFTMTAQTKIAVSGDTRELGERLRADLRPATGFPLDLTSKGGARTISLRLDSKASSLGNEGYRLTSSPDKVEIVGFKPAGVFYGIQTLRQMLPPAIFRQGLQAQTWTLPAAKIEDIPRFSWRGAHLDVGRHFMPKEFLFKFIDLLAMHKLNTFHLHLTEDQGWRIEIKKYPKLTEVGAWRKDTMTVFSPATFEGKPHGGFYTQDDLREVVAYAKQRFVNIVPEIEMPGHSQAAIAAYPELGNLSTPLEVGTSWGVIENIYNVEDATIQFNKDVLTEVMDIFPSTFIHVGGDEVPKKQWKESASAQAKMKALGLKNEEELQSWFMNQIGAFLSAHKRRLIGWDEILEGNLDSSATVMSWRGEEGGITAAKAGHDVVMAPSQWTYLDYYQSKDHSKEPHGIGGFLPLEKVYSWDPLPKGLTPEESKRVLGGQGQLWTEYITGPKHVEYMAFPRLCALAEDVWSPQTSKNYAGFLDRMKAHLERLKIRDVNFRPLD